MRLAGNVLKVGRYPVFLIRILEQGPELLFRDFTGKVGRKYSERDLRVRLPFKPAISEGASTGISSRATV